MTIFAGLMEMAFSLVWRQAARARTARVRGLVVLFIGSIIALAACHMLLRGRGRRVATPTEWLVAGATLALMVGINIWSKSALKILLRRDRHGFRVPRFHLGRPAYTRSPGTGSRLSRSSPCPICCTPPGPSTGRWWCRSRSRLCAAASEHDRRADRLPADD